MPAEPNTPGRSPAAAWKGYPTRLLLLLHCSEQVRIVGISPGQAVALEHQPENRAAIARHAGFPVGGTQ